LGDGVSSTDCTGTKSSSVTDANVVWVIHRAFEFIDSKSISRLSTLATLISVGVGLVGLMIARGPDFLRGDGWIALVCFGVWAALTLFLVIAWIARRRPSTVASPLARIAISKKLPGSSGALLLALTRAEADCRAFIAEAAIVIPALDQKTAYDLAQGFAAFELEVGEVIESASELDQRWSLLWNHRPSWVPDNILRGPFTGQRYDELTRYMALRGRQLGWTVDFLRGGSDHPVRYIRAWVKGAEQARVAGALAGDGDVG
jgi:hypothetical protein